MTPTPESSQSSRTPSPSDLEEIQKLYDSGQFLKAWKRASSSGEPVRWEEPEARVLAGRLMNQVGAIGAGSRHLYATWRRHPGDSAARYYGVFSYRAYRGPLLTRLLMMEVVPAEFSTPKDESDWLGLEAGVLGDLRDFDRAEKSLERAREISPDSSWLMVERTALFEKEDRLAEALSASEAALALRPWFHPAVLSHAHVLTLVDRPIDAVMFLESALEHIESGQACAFLASLYAERRMFDEALNAWALFERYSPIMDEQLRKRHAASLSHLHYLAGNFVESKRWAEAADDPMLDRIAERLGAGGGNRRRKEIAVPFIRQHHVTCAPTTVAMIGRHWSRENDHLAVAEEITYNGTPTHLERNWADRNGWVTREFTLDWEGAVELIDRELPFTLSTYFPGGGHEQAVVGYDAWRRTLLVRDPGSPSLAEYDMEKLLETQRSTGPRCMVMVPAESAGVLETIELRESWERERLFEMQKALDEHDRVAAERELKELLARSPDGLPAFEGKRMMAAYDRNLVGLGRIYDRQLEKMPDDRLLLHMSLPIVAELQGRGAEKAILEKLVAEDDPAAESFLALSQILTSEAGQEQRAERLLERHLRLIPGDSRSISLLASRRWQAGERRLGAELYRLAWTVADMDEGMAGQFFMASVLTGEREAALKILTERFERDGRKAAWPAMTLHNALLESHRTDDAFRALEKAIEMRPEDGDLLLFAADAEARHGRWARADELVEQAVGRAHDRHLRSTRAAIARYRGRLRDSLIEWSKVLDREPLAPEVWQSVAQLTMQVEGPEAAAGMLRSMIERFPYHVPLRRALIDMREGERTEREAEIRALLEIEPADTWARRELAIVYAEAGREQDALGELQAAERIEGRDPSTSSLRGKILEQLGKPEEALAAFEDAIADGISEPYAVYSVLTMGDSDEKRRERARTILERMMQSEASPDAIISWYEGSRELFRWDEMSQFLRKLHEAHPHQWTGGMLLVRHLVAFERSEDAVDVARGLVQRFPFIPMVWLRAADAYGAAGNEDEQRRALETVMEIDPTASEAVVNLTNLMLNRQEVSQAKELLEEASARSPLDPLIPYNLARVAWMTENWEEAFRCFTRTLVLAPHMEDSWAGARASAERMGEPGRVAEVAEEIASQRPGDPRIPIARAESEVDPEKKIAILEGAIRQDPFFHDGYHALAETQVQLGRFHEAIELLEGFGGGQKVLPVGIRGRIAWVRGHGGETERAIAEMSDLVGENPDYRWGVEKLAEMYVSVGDAVNYRKQAARLTRLEPENVISWNRLADAELFAENLVGAEKALERALRCDPYDGWSASVLFDLGIDRRRWTVAEKALQAIERQRQPGEAEWRRVRLATSMGDLDTALRVIETLAAYPGDTGRGLSTAISIAGEHGLAGPVREILNEQVRSGEASPTTAAEWARLEVREGKWKEVEKYVATLTPGSELFGEVMRVFLETLIEIPGGGSRLAKIEKKYGPSLRSDPKLWGTMLWSFSALGQYRKTLEIAGEWERREGVEPWMLLNVSLSHRHLGDDDNGAAVTGHAMELAPDHSRSWHATWAAWDAAKDFAPDSGALLAEVDPADVDAAHIAVRYLTIAVIEAGSRHEGWRATVEANLELAMKSYRSILPRNVLVQRLFFEALRLIRRRKGTGWLVWKRRFSLFLR